MNIKTAIFPDSQELPESEQAVQQPAKQSRPRKHVQFSPFIEGAPLWFQDKTFPTIPTETVLNCLANNEYGDGKLFSLLFAGKCVYDHTSGQWYIWQEHYWQLDRTEFIFHLVSGVLPQIYLQVSNHLKRQINEQEDEQEDSDEKVDSSLLRQRIKALVARAKALEMLARAKNVLHYAQTYLSVTSDRWDTHPWLLGTKDGVIDLRTGELRPGRPEDYIRTVTSTTWQGLDAECPRFERFLQEILADKPEQTRKELIGFLHRTLGYGITGSIREHVFLMLYGEEGRNGKDTLIKTLEKVLGEIVGAVSKDVLINSGKFSAPGSAKPHLVSLQGKRMAWASETDKGEKFDIGQVKFLTGGGTIPARPLYGKEYTFNPSHLLVLMTNNPPHADAGDRAFWERLCPIELKMMFIDNPTEPYHRKKDTTLSEALEAESSGILAWLVRGCMEWQRVGLNIPQSVIESRDQYRKKEDTLGKFIESDCVIEQGCSIRAALLYEDYVKWAQANSLKPMSGTAFGDDMSKRFTKQRKTNGMYYIGIRLRTEADSYADESVDTSISIPEDQPEQRASVPGSEAQVIKPAMPLPAREIPPQKPAITSPARMEVGTTPLPPARCRVCSHTEFRWNGARWKCKKCYPL